jgi:hypothetical protein
MALKVSSSKGTEQPGASRHVAHVGPKAHSPLTNVPKPGMMPGAGRATGVMKGQMAPPAGAKGASAKGMGMSKHGSTSMHSGHTASKLPPNGGR